MGLPQKKTDTIEDIYALPEGVRAELIDGKLYGMAPPNTRHQRLLVALSITLSNFIKEKKGGCEVFIAPFGVFLNADERTYLEPDISVICDPDKVDEEGCKGAPDFIIEIVSPSSRTMDYSTKNALYAGAGVREYWIVDPMKERTTVYRYEEDAAPMIFLFSQEIAVGIYEGLSICISEL